MYSAAESEPYPDDGGAEKRVEEVGSFRDLSSGRRPSSFGHSEEFIVGTIVSPTAAIAFRRARVLALRCERVVAPTVAPRSRRWCSLERRHRARQARLSRSRAGDPPTRADRDRRERLERTRRGLEERRSRPHARREVAAKAAAAGSMRSTARRRSPCSQAVASACRSRRDASAGKRSTLERTPARAPSASLARSRASGTCRLDRHRSAKVRSSRARRRAIPRVRDKKEQANAAGSPLAARYGAALAPFDSSITHGHAGLLTGARSCSPATAPVIIADRAPVSDRAIHDVREARRSPQARHDVPPSRKKRLDGVSRRPFIRAVRSTSAPSCVGAASYRRHPRGRATRQRERHRDGDRGVRPAGRGARSLSSSASNALWVI